MPNQPAILVGVIDTIFPTERIGGQGMYKRIFWLSEVKTDNRKYPMTWQLELWHDATEDIVIYKAGDAIRCTVEVRGNRWTPKGTREEKVFNILRCYKIEKLQPSEVV